MCVLMCVACVVYVYVCMCALMCVACVVYVCDVYVHSCVQCVVCV